MITDEMFKDMIEKSKEELKEKQIQMKIQKEQEAAKNKMMVNRLY